MGGLARSAGRIAHTLTDLGITVDVVTWSRYLQPGDVERLSPPPAPPSPLPTSSPKIHAIGRYRHWDMTMPHTVTVLNWLHETHPFDGVWGHYLFPAGFLAVWFARLNTIPSLVSVRGNDLDRALFPPGDFSRLHWTLTHADTVTAVSQDMAHKVKMVSDRPAIVQKNVVDTTVFQDRPPLPSLRDQLGIRPDEVVLGFSGELREKKGQSFLLNALSQVRAVHPACLLIIGEVRSQSQGIIQSYSAANPEDSQRIIVTGHLDQPDAVTQHLHLCDVFLQPSLWEGMPNALLEAMACGRVCIASDAGGIPEILTHGETGFVLPRVQLHHLGEAVLEYLALPDATKREMASAASQYIHAHHALHHERAQLQSIMDTLMSPKG